MGVTESKAEGRRAGSRITDHGSRLSDWHDRLTAWVYSRFGTPFEWGVMDCELVCIEAIDAMRGTQEILNYRGRYRDARGALRLHRKGLTLEGELARLGVFAWPGVPLFGDLLIHPHTTLPFSSGHVVMKNGYVMSAWPEHGVAYGRLTDALAMPGARVMRVS